MDVAKKLRRTISHQLSIGAGAARASGRRIWRQASFNPEPALPSPAPAARFGFGRQSSLDPAKRSPTPREPALAVPEQLDAAMRLLFAACQGDAAGVERLLAEGIDVNSIDLDGRTALHVASCEDRADVVRLLLDRKANVNARDRWGSTPAADAKYYGNKEVYRLLISRGAKIPKTTAKSPMSVSNARDVPEYELNLLDLEFREGAKLSEGQQVARWNGTKVLVKILNKESYSDPESINNFKHELTLMEKARHPNLVQFVGAVTQNVPMMIIYEYHPKGDLASYLNRQGKLGTLKALVYALDISRGMNYLHECKPDPIIHCNLMPKNILRDDEGKLKVTGFGMVPTVKVTETKLRLVQPMNCMSSIYVAPEVYRNDEFDRSIDVFSFGFILYEMLEGTPFPNTAPEEAIRMICEEGFRPPFMNKSKSYLPDFKELIEECWHQRPEVRPTFSEIIVRLNKMPNASSKLSRWKDKLKLLWK